MKTRQNHYLQPSIDSTCAVCMLILGMTLSTVSKILFVNLASWMALYVCWCPSYSWPSLSQDLSRLWRWAYSWIWDTDLQLAPWPDPDDCAIWRMIESPRDEIRVWFWSWAGILLLICATVSEPGSWNVLWSISPFSLRAWMISLSSGSGLFFLSFFLDFDFAFFGASTLGWVGAMSYGGGYQEIQ